MYLTRGAGNQGGNEGERALGAKAGNTEWQSEAMGLLRALGSYGKFQAGSNTIEMTTLAGRVPGHGESLEAER